MASRVKSALLALLLLACTAVTDHRTPSRHEVISTAQERTIYITADITATNLQTGDKEFIPDTSICGGFLYKEVHGEELIVTANHCLGLEDEVDQTPMGYPISVHIQPREIHFIDGDVAQVQEVIGEQSPDLGFILAHSNRSHLANPPFNDHIKTGDPLFVIGMPAGHLWLYSSATASNDEVYAPDAPQPWHDNTIFVECVSCYQGDSGSAVFDDAGNVVGIVNATTDVPSLLLVTPASVIEQAANQL